MSQTDILVFGGSGFLGQNILDEANRKGIHAIGTYSSHGIDSSNFVKCSLLDLNQPLQVLKEYRPKTVIFAAGYGVNPKDNDFDLAMKVNFESVQKFVVESLERGWVEKFIYVGSCFEYGDQPEYETISESIATEPTTNYALTKSLASSFLTFFGRTKGLPILVTRQFGLYGEHEPSFRLFPGLLRIKQTKEKLPLTSGAQIRDLMFARDAAGVYLDLAHSKSWMPGEILNVGTGKAISIKDFATEVAKQLGVESMLSFGELPYRKNEMMRLVAETTKLKRIIDLKTTPLNESLSVMGVL